MTMMILLVTTTTTTNDNDTDNDNSNNNSNGEQVNLTAVRKAFKKFEKKVGHLLYHHQYTYYTITFYLS